MSTNILLDSHDPMPFIWLNQEQVSWGKWSRDVMAVAEQLEARSAQRWLLFTEDFYLFSVYFVALLASNKTLLLAPSGQADKLRQLAAHVDAVLTDSVHDDLPHWTPSTDWEATTRTRQVTVADDEQLVFYTSGSSGNAKAIIKHWSQLNNEVVTHARNWRSCFASGVFAASVSHHHIYGILFKLLLPLHLKQPVIASLIQYPEQLQALANAGQQINFISSPAFLHRVTGSTEDMQCFKTCQSILSSGGPLMPEAAEKVMQAAGKGPLEIFGSTETGGIAWRQYPHDNMWSPFDGIALRFGDNNRLRIASPFLFAKDWFECDDLAQPCEQGKFRLMGRVDRIVKLEEKRLSLTEMEQRLMAHPLCRQARALIIPGARQQLAVVICPQDAQNITDKKKLTAILKPYLKGYFEAVLLPRKWRYVEQLPTNTEGKTTQSMLQELF